MALASRLDPAREQEILDVALRLTAEVGYEALRMEAVANAARASKATLYRRWRNKAELVLDALHSRRARLPAPAARDTGTLRGDLMEMVRRFCTQMRSAEGRLILALAHAVNSEPELAAAWDWDDFDRRGEVKAEVLRRAVGRGEIAAHVDAEEFRVTLRSIVFGQAWLNGGRLDEAFAARVVDAWLIPYLRHAPPPGPRPAANKDEDAP